jgi:hypothetical protein
MQYIKEIRPNIHINSNYSCLLHALLLFPSIGVISAMHWPCLFAVPRAHRLVTAARAHCECTSMSFIATTMLTTTPLDLKS